MNNFFEMGGYAAYVWPAWGITLAGFAVATALTLRSYFRAKKLLDRIEHGKRP